MIKNIFIKILIFNIFMFQPSIVLAQIIEDTTAPKIIKGQVSFTKPSFRYQIIEDETAKSLKDKNYKKVKARYVLIEDSAIKNDPKFKNKKYLVKHKPYYKLIHETDKITRISISPTELIASKNNPKEGQKLSFVVNKNVYKEGKLFIKKGTHVDATLELVAKHTFYGDPADIEIGRFSTKDIKGRKVKITGMIKEQGANRAIWVKPVFLIGSSIPTLIGLAFNVLFFIKGGKVKIKPNQEFEVYYE